MEVVGLAATFQLAEHNLVRPIRELEILAQPIRELTHIFLPRQTPACQRQDTIDVMIYEAQFQPLNYSFGSLFFQILLVLLFPLVSQMSEPTHWQPETSKDIIDVLIENFRSLIIPLWHSLSMATVTVWQIEL